MKETEKHNDNTRSEKTLSPVEQTTQIKDLVQSDTKKETEEKPVEKPKEDGPVLECGWI